MEAKTNSLLMDLADVVIERPQGFNVGSRHFYLYPISLGKMYLMSKLVEGIGFDMKALAEDPHLEICKAVKAHKADCCRILSYITMPSKQKAFDNEYVDSRAKYLEGKCSDEDVAVLLSYVLTDKTDEFKKELGITEEQERMEKVVACRKSKNTYSFGGKSVYGMLIDTACERYGWTMEYVVWGISYTNLKLLLADSTRQISLSEEEAKSCPVRPDYSDVPYIDGKEGWDIVNSMDWD